MSPTKRSTSRAEWAAPAEWAAVFTVLRVAAVAANKTFLKRRQAAHRREEPNPFF